HDLMTRGAQKLAFVYHHSIIPASRGRAVEIVHEEDSHNNMGGVRIGSMYKRAPECQACSLRARPTSPYLTVLNSFYLLDPETHQYVLLCSVFLLRSCERSFPQRGYIRICP